MQSFRLWFEAIELRRPNKLKRTTIIKDKGTNVARKVIQFAWKTKYNNEIKMYFEPKGDDEYSLIFYVNNVLDDYGSKLGLANQDAVYDSDILSNVFYVMKQKADQLKAKTLIFSAHSSLRDNKTIRNIDIKQYEEKAIQELAEFSKRLNAYEVKMIEPSANLINIYNKIGKKANAMPDINKNSWQNWVISVNKSIENKYPYDLADLLNQLKNNEHNLQQLSPKNLTSALSQLLMALESNTDKGYTRTSNRRTEIYKKILNRYFSQDWDIKIRGNSFTLTRL